MGLRAILNVAFLFLGAAPLFAGPADPPPLLHYSLQIWTRHEGLPLNSVRDIAFTPDGYMWLATEVGLVRFDGVRFTLFDSSTVKAFPGDLVEILKVDGQGTLWIGLNGGLVRFRDGVFTPAPLEGFANTNVKWVETDARGDLWVATQKDLAVLRDGAFRRVSINSPSEPGGRVCATPDGAIWQAGVGLVRLKDGKETLWQAGKDIPGSVLAMAPDAEGVLWIGTSEGALGTVRGERFVPAPDLQRFGGPIMALHAARDGSLWVGVLGGGLFRYRGGRLESLTTREGLKSDDILVVKEDGQGHIWLGTNGGGLACLRRSAVSVISQREGLSHRNALSVFEDSRRRLWVGTSGGEFNRITGSEIDKFGAALGLDPAAVLSMAEHEGALWVGTGGGGLFRFDGRAFLPAGRSSAVAGTVVMSLLTAGDGTLWVGSERGLKKKEKDRFVDVPFLDKGGQETAAFVISLAEDREGTIWAGTQGLGLFRVGPGPGGPAARDVGLGNLVVLALRAESDGSLWIGTAGEGLLRRRDGGVDSFRKKDGLPDDMVFSIQADDQDRFWMSGNAGIFRVGRADLQAFTEKRLTTLPVTLYGPEDGLRAAECTGGGQNAGWTLRDGRVAFATPDGLALVDPHQLPGAGAPPRTGVESLVCDGQTLPMGAPGPKVEIPGGFRRCEIAFTGFDPASAPGLAFQYRIRGFEEQWQEAGSRRTADFTRLGPGEYTFEVRARNREGVKSPAPAALTFRVLRRVHETWWFRAAGLLLLVAGAWGAYGLRVGHLIRRQRHLEQVVAERTAEIAEANRTLEGRVEEGIARLREADRMAAYGTLVAGVAHEVRHPIFAIQMASYVLQQELAGNEGIADQLKVLDRETRRMTALTNDLVEFARPAALEKARADVALILREAVASFRAEHPECRAAVEIDEGEGLSEALLDSARIVQVLVNLMENAHKHAQGLTRLGLSARMEEGKILLEVANDGSPVPPEILPRLFEPFFTTGHGTGLGLSIVKRVIEQHGGSISVASVPPTGTRFTLTLPRA